MHCRKEDYSVALDVTFDYFMLVQYCEIKGPAVSPYRGTLIELLYGVLLLLEYILAIYYERPIFNMYVVCQVLLQHESW